MMTVFHMRVLLIDNEFRHNIVKVVHSYMYFDNVMMKFMINHRTDARKTEFVNLRSIVHAALIFIHVHAFEAVVLCMHYMLIIFMMMMMIVINDRF